MWQEDEKILVRKRLDTCSGNYPKSAQLIPESLSIQNRNDCPIFSGIGVQSKSESVSSLLRILHEEGFLKAKELFERHFAKKATVIPMPKLSKDAKRRWDQVPESIRKEILDSVWCSHCRGGSSMQLQEGKMSGRSLVLRGTCKKCGGETARVIEPGEE